MRTVYGSNPVPTSSSDVEINIDVPEAEEVAFTLVTNKKRDKGKAKVSSPPPINSRNKILLVSRAPPAPKVVTASTASKLAATCSSSAVAAVGILFLANTCLLLHHWPRHFKKSVSVIIPKLGKPAYDTPKVFRPIVLLHTLGKLIEKMIARRLQFDAVKYGILHPN